MPTTVLATKLFPPARRSGLVARPWLVERLDSTLEPGHRLALVSAPAGFGKTTLVAEWAAGHERVGWLSLDDGDNELPRFLAHLWAALPGIQVAPPAADVPTTAALTALVNDYASRPDTQSVLVLDDYHVIEALDVHEAVAFLLDHLPDQLHLVVATRADPPFPLARLRGRGQLTEIRVDDLRFAAAEAGAFLNDVMGLQLAADDVLALEGRTEGWVAGLQLAALSLRGVSEVAGFIDAFTGSHRFVIDYLADEVLARQPAPVRDFLLRTAVLDRLTGSLCDAVTGQRGSDRVLDELDRGNVFLVALDAGRTWYRYHHLFHDVLRARLLAERPEELPRLHRAASEWYVEQQMAPDAVRHALAAGDHERAAFLIEEALPEARRARQDSLLLSWIRSLPESVVRRRPVLCITAAWASMMAGELDRMARWLDDAEAALAAGDPAGTWADTEDLRTAPALILVYRAALAQARGDVAATVLCAERALELAGPDDHFVLGAAGGFVALAAWAAGDVEQALTTFATAVRSLQASGSLTDVQDSAVVIGDLWMAAGRPSRARQTFEQALAAATRDGEPYPRVTADLHVGLAELDRELDDLAGAEAHLETSRTLAEHGSITENRHRWSVAMAQVQVARGDVAAALRLLDDAEGLYRRGTYPEIRPIAAMRARVHLAAGDLVAAGAWATGISDTVSYLHEYEQLTLARLLIHRGDDVLGLLDRLRGDASRRAGSLLEIDVLRALALHVRGERSDALAALRQALAAAPEPERYVRLFLDEGAPMRALLQDAAPDEPLVRRLLKAPTALPDPLTERELDVLRLLDTELTGPEIARRLYVSLNTLRTHTKRIFTKLGATNRSGAVRRARERGLL
ncbi:LuxR C-terminal-related transcriptional regulator [Kribbella soli]|uniref:Helix-turn-helix transcriptional regulator n=1 Tax=Kribbella soli TaxID=1124743 RepID=A0A4R0H733_9ACTN|nr:LuxR C-terminal-related transcriptional regulator [Kribbella soli]TCC04332.1 helix-turn-helix transcriptional regulator [Kribbella soli]